VVHHGVPPVWFEMGSTELLRVNPALVKGWVNGLLYKDLEQASVFFVVTELRIKYR
jgi:acyl-CoA thioesterase FadM